MMRGLIVGAAAFAVAYLLEGEWSKLQPDIARYDGMRAMSGDVPLMREQLSPATGLFGWLLNDQSPAADGASRGFFQSLREDLVRYARLETM